ncbi:transposase [Buchananella felis]|uniref:transposase n=1 Tax=Buchananella felis TaxID=3231492 RepID=UPI0035280A1D
MGPTTPLPQPRRPHPLSSPPRTQRRHPNHHPPPPRTNRLTPYQHHEGPLHHSKRLDLKDVWSNRIVALSSATYMSTSLAVNALAQAVADRHPPAGCVIHSDRGAQFTSTAYRQAALAYGLVQSMGQAGTCADNAAMESFFALLQKNVLNTRKWETRQELATAIRHWIEATYHRRRHQVRLGKLTPIEYETIYTN